LPPPLSVFNPLYINTNQQLLEKKVATMKIMDDFCSKSTLFVVSKDEWNTKEGTDNSMKNALYAQWYGKRHLSGIKQQKKSSL